MYKLVVAFLPSEIYYIFEDWEKNEGREKVLNRKIFAALLFSIILLYTASIISTTPWRRFVTNTFLSDKNSCTGVSVVNQRDNSTISNLVSNDCLVAYWSFEENDGWKTYDCSGNENHGTHYGNTRLLMHFDEGSGTAVHDESVYGNDGTLAGGIWTTGVSGYAIHFDGIADYIEIPDSSSIDMTLSISLEFWINPLSLPANFSSIPLAHGTYSDSYWIELYCSGELAFWIRFANNVVKKVSIPSLPLNTWTHVVATYDFQESLMKIYENGKLINFQQYGASMKISDTPLFIAKAHYPIGSNFGGWYFHGLIDEVAIYSRALKPDEIKAHYNAKRAHFTDWTSGKCGVALNFDGIDDYVEVQDSYDLDITEAITIMAWVKFDDFTSNQFAIVHKWVTPASYVLEVTNSSGYYYPRLTIHTTTGYATCVSSVPISTNIWYFLAGTYDSSTGQMNFYLDGNRTATRTFSGPLTPNDGPLRIGKRSDADGDFMNGAIDEVRVYNRALSESEIRDYMLGTWPLVRQNPCQTGLSLSEAPTQLWPLWRFYPNITYAELSPCIADGKVFIGLGENLYALDSQNGSLLWKFQANSSIRDSPAFSQGIVYASFQGHLYALNATTGKTIWKQFIKPTGAPTIVGNTLYVCNGSIVALDKFTGSLIWKSSVPNMAICRLAVAYGKVFVMFIKFPNGVNVWGIAAFDRYTGAYLWNFTIEGTFGSDRTPIAIANGMVFASFGSGLYALNAKDGTLIWHIPNFAYPMFSIAYGKLFVADDKSVVALDISSGSLIWNYTTSDWVSIPSVADGKVIFGCSNGEIYILDANTGSKISAYGTNNQYWSAPSIAYGKIYIVTEREIYAFIHGGGGSRSSVPSLR